VNTSTTQTNAAPATSGAIEPNLFCYDETETDPHALKLTVSNADCAAFHRLPTGRSNSSVIVTNFTGTLYRVRRHACGLGCYCAAIAEPVANSQHTATAPKPAHTPGLVTLESQQGRINLVHTAGGLVSHVASCFTVCLAEEHGGSAMGNAERLRDVWNATLGMGDPAAEIARLRAVLERIAARFSENGDACALNFSTGTILDIHTALAGKGDK